MAQDALVAALERWPDDGLPRRPGAWLMATAKHRAVDRLRQQSLHQRKEGRDRYGDRNRPSRFADIETALDDDIGDDLLNLIFIACHPILSVRGAHCLDLALRRRASPRQRSPAPFLSPNRRSRSASFAPSAIAEARIPFEVPRGESARERLSSVLQVLYLIFNEGYAATSGEDWMRPACATKPCAWARILVGLAPDEPEVHGLVALMEFRPRVLPRASHPTARRFCFSIRIAPAGTGLLIRRGLAALARAEALTDTPGPYELQAAIAACHARAATAR